MTLELAKDGYAKLEQDIMEIESLAEDILYTSWNLGDMVRGYLRITQAARELRQTLRNVVLMVPDAATVGEGGAA